MKLLTTMASGFESVTARELKQMGYETQTENGKVYFQGELADIAKTNLWLRSADRVKIVLADFYAKTFDELFNQIKNIPWDTYLPMNAAFPITARSVKSTLYSESDIQSIAKKAVVDNLSSVYHRKTRLPETGNLYPLHVSILKDHVEVTLDTTGDSLFKRGYRVDKGVAPLKENFAAALILLTNWRPEQTFIDPMTGSGTIAIEAGLIARNIAPGLKRHFTFEQFDWFSDDILLTEQQIAKDKINHEIEVNINASDINENMIEIARVNANNANLLNDISFKHIALKDLKIDPDTSGVIVANPPYGKRLSDQETIKEISHEMHDIFLPLTHMSKYILTADENFEKEYGVRANKKRKLYNGRLKVEYYQFFGRK